MPKARDGMIRIERRTMDYSTAGATEPGGRIARPARHPGAAASLQTWWDLTTAADCYSFVDVRASINSADHVDEHVIFNIRGNYDRLVTWIDYGRKLVVIKWFGRHQEYDDGAWK